METSTHAPTHALSRGSVPLLVSFPHAGTGIPPDIEARMTPEALLRADTDWHLPLLYDFVAQMGASTLVPQMSRYVIDLNRPPEDTNLYPGQDTTGLVPQDTFHKQPLYRDGQAPGADEVAARRERFWQPYHDTLRGELERLRDLHGGAVLWDAHSISSVLPRFFDGKLPDLNLGTGKGISCDPSLAQTLLGIAESATGYTGVLNGRFTGGYITRNYGNPAQNVHAVQLEMTQSSYMQEKLPFDYLPEVAAGVQPHVRRMIEAVLAFVEGRAKG